MMDAKKVTRSQGWGNYSDKETALPPPPPPRTIERVQLLEDWYACDQAQAILVAYDQCNRYRPNTNGLPILFPTGTEVTCYDPGGMINGELLAFTDDLGQLFIPKDMICEVYRPLDANDSHYELVHAGTGCEEQQASGGSASQGSGGSGASGASHEQHACDLGRLPPLPKDASLNRPYVLRYIGGCPYWAIECCQSPPCPNCDISTLPEQLNLQLTTDFNVSGLCADCNNWTKTWPMVPLDYSLTTELWEAYPMTFAGYPLDPDNRGCWYIATDDLPCGCNFLAAEIFESHPNGVIEFWFGWEDGTFVRLQVTWDSTPGRNCLINFANPGQPDGIGHNTGGAPPCDFLLVITNLALAKTSLIVTAS